jgi:Ca2+-transporting ATPase
MSQEFHKQTVRAVSSRLEVTPENGLDNQEAQTRLEQYGPNTFDATHTVSAWRLFLNQFKDVLIIVLLVAAVISLGLGIIESDGSIKEGVLIFAIVLAIAIVGFLNEYKAERTVEALRNLVGHTARVRRGGEIRDIESSRLVPGDLVLFQEGEKVPADVRLTTVNSLEVDESSLTGESMPVSKQTEPVEEAAALGDQSDMLFSGTFVNTGSGEGLVVATGENSQIGQIAGMVDTAEQDLTPMQKKLDRLGRRIGVGVLFISIIVFIIIFLADAQIQEAGLLHRLVLAFTAAVALAVAAIPEGLAFVVRISLALGARRMAGRNALVRKLSAVEALGSTDTICSDKTGTLTRGEMTVREIRVNGQSYHVEGSGYKTEGAFYWNKRQLNDLGKLKPPLKIGLLCNNATLADEGITGDPTEGALLVSAAKAGINLEQANKAEPRVNEIPFSSARKMMSTVHQTEDGYAVYTKGSPEAVLDKATHILINGQEQQLTEERKQDILEQNQTMSLQALRVLGFAYKQVKTQPADQEVIESKLVFAGLQGMMDPPRTEIKQVINRVSGESGMRVIMVTGDHIDTARAIASEIGIEGEAISGTELDELTQEAFEDKAENIAIYARVNPEHKIRIVRALKKHGHQVAVTGDGVNDAPAIKAADIGVAMGITGSDVSKEASDLILLDDQFLTIVAAVEEGRGIFDNVRKFVNYLLSANIAEVLAVFFGVVVFQNLILTAVHLLFINIVTDGLPAIALGSDPAERGIMKYLPHRFQGSIINTKLWIEMFIFGALMSVIVLVQFAYNLDASGLGAAMSSAFVAMVVLEMVRLVNIRSDFRIGWLSNPWLLVAIASSLGIVLAVLYVPFLSGLFELAPISSGNWLYIGGSAAALFVIMRAVRSVLKRLSLGQQSAASY